MSVPSCGSRMHGPLLVDGATVKWVAASFGVGGEPSSGIASMMGADGKSVHVVHAGVGRVQALPGGGEM